MPALVPGLPEAGLLALREFARLSKLRFDKGVSGYLEVLVAENELFAAELASVSLQASRYAQIVNVYQAMGGGWVDVAARSTSLPTMLRMGSCPSRCAAVLACCWPAASRGSLRSWNIRAALRAVWPWRRK